jgi:hypothetical protein
MELWALQLNSMHLEVIILNALCSLMNIYRNRPPWSKKSDFNLYKITITVEQIEPPL